MAYRFGLKPPRPGAIKLQLATYLDFSKLPTPPDEFGHYDLITDWGMLGNDDWGDCAEAGACHQTMLFTAEGTGAAASFDTPAALRNYTEVAQFDPNAGGPGENPTDQGTDMGVLASHWVKEGIVDAGGTYHKLVATLDLHPGDLRELWVASYLFQAIGLGFSIPASAIKQNRNGQPWDVVKNDGGIQGGHYVPCVGKKAGNGLVVTWGKLQAFTPAFYEKYSIQGFAGLSEEMLKNSKSIDGFDDALLRSDLQLMSSGRTLV